MAKKLTKALRGKKRWIGCNCQSFSSRDDLIEYLSNMPVRLYDFTDGKCIVSVRLEDYDLVRESFSQGSVISETSSGKIRLVRERMGIKAQARKR